MRKGEAAFHQVAPPKPAPVRSPAERELLDLQNKVAELERFCGQLALENTILLRKSTLRVKKAQELFPKSAK